jgi:hypothetical protein
MDTRSEVFWEGAMICSTFLIATVTLLNFLRYK